MSRSKLTEWGAAIEHAGHGVQSPQIGRSAREATEKEAVSRRATDAQVPEDAERLIGAWNEQQAG
jgi:hypothetical protein